MKTLTEKMVAALYSELQRTLVNADSETYKTLSSVNSVWWKAFFHVHLKGKRRQIRRSIDRKLKDQVKQL